MCTHHYLQYLNVKKESQNNKIWTNICAQDQFKKLRSLYGHTTYYTYKMYYSLNILLWYVFSYTLMDTQVNNVPLNVQLLRLNEKTLCRSAHLNWILLWPQHKTWHLKGHMLKVKHILLQLIFFLSHYRWRSLSASTAN